MQALLAISILCVLTLVWVAISIARYLNASHRRAHASSELLSIVPKMKQSAPLETDFKRVLANAIDDSQLPAPVFANAEPTNHTEVAEAIASNEVIPALRDTPSTPEFPAHFNTPIESLGSISGAPIAANRFSRAALMAEESTEAAEPGVTIRMGQLQQRAAELQQNVHDISSSKGWNMPPKPLRSRTTAATSSSAVAEPSDNSQPQVVAKPVMPNTRAAIHPTIGTSETRFVLNAGTEGARKPAHTLRRGLTQRLDRAYASNSDPGDLTDPYQISRAGTYSGMTPTKQARS